MPRRKIAFLTNPWAFQVAGGGERILLESRAELLRRGHRVDPFDLWHGRFSDYDVLHYFHCPGWESWERIKKLGARLVVTPTLWWDPPERGWLHRQLRHFAHRLADPWWSPPIDERDARAHLMIPDLLLPTSEEEAWRLERYLDIPRCKLMVVRNAVAVDDIAPPPPDLEEALDNGNGLLCVGSFHSVKNQLGIIRAAKGTDFRIVFIGSSYVDDADGYLEACRKEAGGAHWFFPQQPHGVVLGAMQRAKVYVQPSLRETCGLAALEAGALGCQVAITERGATREYFSDFAWYFDPEDQASMRLALERAYANKGSRGLASYIWTNHLVQRLGADLESVYRTVIR